MAGGHGQDEEGKLEGAVEPDVWRDRWRKEDKIDKEIGGTGKIAPLV